MAKGYANQAWNRFIRFEKYFNETHVEVKINNDNGANLFVVRCHGADAELIAEGQGEGGENEVELTVKLDPIPKQSEVYGLSVVNNEASNVDGVPYEKDVKVTSFINPNSPNSKYRTTTVHFNSENAPVVKLYCIDNYNWELHLNDVSRNVYQIYNFNLKVGGYTTDCSVSLLQNQSWKLICEFRKRFFSTSSAKVEFKTEVTIPTLKLLMTVMAYFRYSYYGENVTLDGVDPNIFNGAEYNNTLKRIRESKERLEALKRKQLSSHCFDPSHVDNNLESLCTHLRYDKNITSHCCNPLHNNYNINPPYKHLHQDNSTDPHFYDLQHHDNDLHSHHHTHSHGSKDL